MNQNSKIAVLGAGLWGTVLAETLSRKNREVWLWEFFPQAARALSRTRRHPQLPGFRLRRAVAVTSDLPRAAARAEVLLFVLPSEHVRATAAAVKRLAWNDPLVVNASKGVEPGTLKTMGEVIASELGLAGKKVYTLSGPSIAAEVARAAPTKIILAGSPGYKAARFLRLLDGPTLRVESSADRKGVELGGSLKNALAIGCGVLDGLKAGANTKAALIIQGLEEMGRLIGACGGSEKTLYGLAGLGDLIATGTSKESRNRGFGERLGRGKTPGSALRAAKSVVEGVAASQSAHQLCRKLRIEAPLLEMIWKVVHRGHRPRGILDSMGFNSN